MATPSVTAIVPTFERPEMLSRALRSIMAQTLPPGEIVVVDDGSASQSALRGAIEGSEACPLTLIANCRGKGASGARNSGAEVATSDILAFLDDDDEWLPEFLDAGLCTLIEGRSDVVCTDLLYVGADAAEVSGKKAPERLSPEKFMITNPGFIGSNLLINRKAFWGVGGFDETLPSMNDLDFGLRLSLVNGLHYSPCHRRLVRHHNHSGPRLSARQSAVKATSISRFLALHGERFNQKKREEFSRHMQALWGLEV